MSQELREKTTIAEWLATLPTTEEIRNEDLKPTREEAEAHVEWVTSLFDDVEIGKLTALIVDAVGILQVRDLNRALAALEVMHNQLYLTKVKAKLKMLVPLLERLSDE